MRLLMNSSKGVRGYDKEKGYSKEEMVLMIKRIRE